MIAKASNIDDLNFVSLHLHTNLHFEDKVNIAKRMSHSICEHMRMKTDQRFLFRFRHNSHLMHLSFYHLVIIALDILIK